MLNKAVEASSQCFADYVLENYEEVTSILFTGSGEFELDGDFDSMRQFHADKVFMLEANDEYLFGIRANHFVVEEGYSENHFYRKGEEGKEEATTPSCILVSANHKENRWQKLYVEK